MSYKRMAVLFLVMLLLFCHALPGFANERVGVLGFSGRVGEEYRIMAIDKLTKILFNFGVYAVVERAEIERILTEQRLQASGVVDTDTAVKIGKILGINLAYIGSIDQLTANFNQKSNSYSSIAKITIKVIEVQTAKIVNIIETSGFGSNKDRRTAFYEALEGCFSDKIVAGIRAKIAPFSKVYKVDGDVLYFINGKNIGVKKGLRYRILRPEISGFDEGAGDNSFKRQIGLVEVSEVIEDKAQAKIIWKSESVKIGDLLQEEVNPWHGLFSLQIHSIGSNLDDSTLVFEGAIGGELPYKSSGKLTFGYTPLSAVGVLNFGYQAGWETPIIPGVLYFTPYAGAGFALGFQDYYVSVTRYSGVAGGFYLNGGCGLKLYLNHENGIRLKLGAIGQLGPYFGRWADSEYSDYDVTSYMIYPDVYLGGFGILFSVSM